MNSLLLLQSFIFETIIGRNVKLEQLHVAPIFVLMARGDNKEVASSYFTRLIIESKSAGAFNYEIAASGIYHTLSRVSILYRYQEGIKTDFHVGGYIFLTREAAGVKKVCVFKRNSSSNVFHAPEYSNKCNERGLEPMQRIESLAKTKSASPLKHFHICNKFMVRGAGLEPARLLGTTF